MGIVVLGAVFVDIKGYPADVYIPGGRNAGRVEIVHGGVSRNLVEDIANVELRPTFVSLVDTTGTGADVIRKLQDHKVNTDYIRAVPDGMGIEFDKNSYLWDEENPISSRYVMCGHDTRVAARLLAENWQQVVSTEDLVIYKRP